MFVRAPHLAALLTVLAVGAWLLLHGASAKPVPGVAFAGTPAAHASSAAAPKKATDPPATHRAAHSAAKGGTKLSATQIWPFTYEVYPSASSQLTQADAGFQISVHPASASERKVVIRSQLGGSTALQQNFQASDRAYWIETSYGDDAPGQDANLGDDGFVLTDAQGYITQK